MHTTIVCESTSLKIELDRENSEKIIEREKIRADIALTLLRETIVKEIIQDLQRL